MENVQLLKGENKCGERRGNVGKGVTIDESRGKYFIPDQQRLPAVTLIIVLRNKFLNCSKI